MARAKIRGDAGLDTRGFDSGTRRMERGVSGVKDRLGAMKGIIAGAFSVGAIVAFTRSVVNLGSKISDMVMSTGVQAQTLQALMAVAREAGAKEEDMAKALAKVKMAQGRVIEGEKTYIDMFKALGIEQEKVATLGTEELFMEIAKSLTESGNSALQYNAVMEIIGSRSGPRLVEVLNTLAEKGLPRVIEEQKKLGQVMRDETIKEMDEMADRYEQIVRKMQVKWANFLVMMVDGLHAFGVATKQLFAGKSWEEAWQEAAKVVFGDPADKTVFEKLTEEERAELAKEGRVAAFKKRKQEEEDARRMRGARGGRGAGAGGTFGTDTFLRQIGGILAGEGQQESIALLNKELQILQKQLAETKSMNKKLDKVGKWG